MNLTAKEQYELVKDHPEVFEHVMFYQPPASDGLGCWRGTSSNWFIRDDIAVITLTALFMLAAECGVFSSAVGFYDTFDVEGKHSNHEVNHPLTTTIAAYKRRSGT